VKGTSSTAEAKQVASTMQGAEESIVVPKMPIVEPAEAKDDAAEEPKFEKIMKMPEILSPPAEAELRKVQKAPAVTPKRRRMASVLDVVMKTTKALSPAPVKKITEAEPSVSIEMKASTPEDKAEQQTSDTDMVAEQDKIEKAKSPAPEALVEDVDYIIRHASGKKLSKEEILEARHYAQKLKYLKGGLVFNGTNEDNFLYCLPETKKYPFARR
jgi:hypothetical protein